MVPAREIILILSGSGSRTAVIWRCAESIGVTNRNPISIIAQEFASSRSRNRGKPVALATEERGKNLTRSKSGTRGPPPSHPRDLGKQFRRLFPAITLFFYGAWLLSTCLVLLGFDWDSPAAPATAAPPVVSSSSGALVPSYNEQNVHIGFVQTGPTVPGAVKREPAIGPVLVPSSKLPQLVEPLLCAQKGALEGPDRNLKFNFNEDEMNQTGSLMTLGLQQLR
ncbi:hypothetical protein C8J56DRAFT_1027045 [Mycena floridula]|nr:hypothetical protein C8J56DRAFT_1027045 [Mycena floridula]